MLFAASRLKFLPRMASPLVWLLLLCSDMLAWKIISALRMIWA